MSDDLIERLKRKQEYCSDFNHHTGREQGWYQPDADCQAAAAELEAARKRIAELEGQRDALMGAGEWLSERVDKAEAALDALGVAIANAGYTWTKEMREAYEKGTNAKR